MFFSVLNQDRDLSLALVLTVATKEMINKDIFPVIRYITARSDNLITSETYHVTEHFNDTLSSTYLPLARYINEQKFLFLLKFCSI